MQYIYDVGTLGKRKETTTTWGNALKMYYTLNGESKYISVHKELEPKSKSVLLISSDDIEDWQVKLDREITWKPKEALEINKPKEVKTIIETLHEIMVELGLEEFMLKDDIKKEPLLKEATFKNSIGIGLNPQTDWLAYDNYFNSRSTSKKPKDHINPSHYQSFFGGIDKTFAEELQWLETIQYTKQYRNPEIFKAAVELQARKYLDRLGGKDAEPQEIKKSIWYLKFLAAYIANDNKPIRVKDIENILSKI